MYLADRAVHHYLLQLGLARLEGESAVHHYLLGFLAAFFALGFLTFFALGFLTFLAAFFFLGFLTLGTAPSLNLPAPLPEARAFFRVPLASPLLSPRRTLTAAVLASTLLLATTYFRMAWREEPPRSFNPAIAAAII